MRLELRMALEGGDNMELILENFLELYPLSIIVHVVGRKREEVNNETGSQQRWPEVESCLCVSANMFFCCKSDSFYLMESHLEVVLFAQ